MPMAKAQMLGALWFTQELARMAAEMYAQEIARKCPSCGGAMEMQGHYGRNGRAWVCPVCVCSVTIGG